MDDETNDVYPTMDELLRAALTEPDFDDQAARTEIHERNVRHLRAYVKARREHLMLTKEAGRGCEREPLCSGKPVRDALESRLGADPAYFDMLILSALVELDRQGTQIDTLTAELVRVDAELINVTGDLADTNRQLFETQTALNVCEAIVAEARPYRPAES